MALRNPVSAWLAATALAVSCCAAQAEHSNDEAAHAGPVTGGLSLVPEQWRYRAAPSMSPVQTELMDRPISVGVLSGRQELLEADYVADRGSFINTVRARRGVSLLTLWEGAGRCLFFGINDRGRAGLNFVRLRRENRRVDTEPRIHQLYAELTGQPRATFPEPPRLFPH